MFDEYEEDLRRPRFNLMSFCAEIERLKMIEFEYNKLKIRHEKLERDFQELLESGLKHNQTMMDNFLKLAIEAPDKMEAAFGGKKK